MVLGFRKFNFARSLQKCTIGNGKVYFARDRRYNFSVRHIITASISFVVVQEKSSICSGGVNNYKISLILNSFPFLDLLLFSF